MTLVVSGVNKHHVWTATDKLLTDAKTGRPVKTVPKSFKFDAGDGFYLVSFTGVASVTINGRQVEYVDWLIDQLTIFRASQHSLDEVIDFVAKQTEKYVIAPYYHYKDLRSHLGHAVVFAGWQLKGNRHKNIIRVITNMQDMGRNHLDVPTSGFITQRITHEMLTVHGNLYATTGTDFKQQKKYTKHMLRRNDTALDETIRDSMAEMIIIASHDPKGGGIGNEVMASMIDYHTQGIDYRNYPESSNWEAPGFVTDTMSVTGITVRNDFVKGGRTVIGGVIPELEEIIKKAQDNETR